MSKLLKDLFEDALKMMGNDKLTIKDLIDGNAEKILGKRKRNKVNIKLAVVDVDDNDGDDSNNDSSFDLHSLSYIESELSNEDYKILNQNLD